MISFHSHLKRTWSASSSVTANRGSLASMSAGASTFRTAVRHSDCIRDEMFGERHYAANDAGAELDSDAWQDWHENSINEIPF